LREEERKTINQNMKIYFKFGILILCELSFSLVLSLIVKIKYENNDGYNLILYIGVCHFVVVKEEERNIINQTIKIYSEFGILVL
jgi:hypothetical protein